MSNLKAIKLVSLAVVGLAASGCATQPGTAPAAAPAAAAKPATPPGPPAAPSKKLTRADASVLAGNCFTCHGPNGHSPGTVPSLDKLKRARLISDMKDFQQGAPSTVMGRQAKGYSDAEIEAIADYLASLKKN